MDQKENYNYYTTPGIFQQSYSNSIYVLSIISLIYLGIYITLNNHFVFKPKIHQIIQKYKPNQQNNLYRILFEILIDIICNLSSITFVISSIYLSSSHNAIATYIISDGIWMGIWIGIIIYKNREFKEHFEIKNIKLLLKNGICLLLMYINLVIHYGFEMFGLEFGFVLGLFYILNHVSNIYFEKIQMVMKKILFGEEQQQEICLENLNEKAMYPEAKFLAQNFSVSEEQYIQRSKKVSLLRSKMKLKSKALIYQKFHELHYKISIAHQKYKDNQIKKSIVHYSKLNGTYDYNQKTYQIKQIYQKKQIPLLSQPHHSFHIESNSQSQQTLHPFIYYIFPIKIFDFSFIISIIFTIIINLAYGFLIDITIQSLLKLSIGYSIVYIPAIFTLPSITKVNLIQFYNSLTLSAIFRYGFIGILAVLNLISNSNMNISWSLNTTLYLNILVQTLYLLISFLITFFMKWPPHKLLILTFLIIFGIQNSIFYLNSLQFY